MELWGIYSHYHLNLNPIHHKLTLLLLYNSSIYELFTPMQQVYGFTSRSFFWSLLQIFTSSIMFLDIVESMHRPADRKTTNIFLFVHHV